MGLVSTTRILNYGQLVTESPQFRKLVLNNHTPRRYSPPHKSNLNKTHPLQKVSENGSDHPRVKTESTYLNFPVDTAVRE